VSEPHLVLVVEDDPSVAEFLQLALRAMGHEAVIAADGQQALQIAAGRQPRLVLLDALLPKLDGFGVLRELRKSLPQVPIVMMSGIYQKRSYVQEAADLGARDYLFKPLSVLKVWELAERYLGEAAAGSRDPGGFAGTPLSERPLACSLASLLQERATGMLFVRAKQGIAILFVEDGRVIFGRSNDAQTRLDRVLESLGMLSPEQGLQARRMLEKAKGRARLGDLLVESGALSEGDLRAALDKQQRMHVTRPLTWTDGCSQFFASDAPRQESFKLELDMEALVVWAARHLPAGPALEAWLPSSRSLLTSRRDLNQETARFALSERELELLSLADGTRTLGALRAMGRLAQVDLDRLAAALCALGVLEAAGCRVSERMAGSAVSSAPAAGAVASHPTARVLLGTGLAGKTGALRFEDGPSVRTVWFDDGCIAFANSNDPQDRLGQVLLRSKFVTNEQLRAALEVSKATPGSALGRILVDQGTLTLDDLHAALVAQVREVVAGLVCWQEGTFNFTSGPLPTQEIVPLALDPLELVLAALRVTPFTALVSVLPARESHLRKTWQCFELAAEIELTQLEDRLLSELDAKARVGGLLDALGEDAEASLRAVHLLLSLGLIEEGPAPADSAAGENAALAEDCPDGGFADDGFAGEGFGDEGFGDEGFAGEGFGDEGFGDEGFGIESGEPSGAPATGRGSGELGGEVLDGSAPTDEAAPAADSGATIADPEQSFAGLADDGALSGLIQAGSALDPQSDFGMAAAGAEDSFAGLADEPALSGLIEAGSAEDPQAGLDFAGALSLESGDEGRWQEPGGLAAEDSNESTLFAGELRGETGFSRAIDPVQAETGLDFGLSEDTQPESGAGVQLGAELAAAFAGIGEPGPATAGCRSSATATLEASPDLAVQTFFAQLSDHLRANPGAIPERVLASLPPELRERFGM
jgi:CheY-like chemotaxis protein